MEIYRLENILRQSPEVASLEQSVVMTDEGGTIVYWNSGAEALYGWRANEAEGRKILDVIPTRVSQEQAEKMMADLRGGRKWSGTFLVQKRDGTISLTHAVGLPVCDDRGSLIGIVTISAHILDPFGVGKARRVIEGFMDDQPSLAPCPDNLDNLIGSRA
jgi:PAS domain S-box-containing protein